MSLDGLTFSIERSHQKGCYARVTRWLHRVVSFPSQIYHTFVFAKYKEFFKPIQQATKGRDITFIPILGAPNMHIVTHPDIMAKALGAGYRTDPVEGLFEDRATPALFVPLLKDLYPGHKFTQDDLLLMCHKDMVGPYRSIILEFIGPQNIRKQKNAIDTIVQQTLDYWDPQKGKGEKPFSVDATAFTGVFATAIISRLLLKHPGPFEEYEKINAAITQITKALMQKMFKQSISKEEYDKAIATIRSAIYIAQKAQGADSFVAALTKAGMSDSRIKAMLFGMFLGGSETTATALKYLLWQLGQNPQYQEKLLKDPGEMDKLLNEALRLCTPVFIIGRTAAHDLTIQGKDKQGAVVWNYNIPKGEAIVSAPPFAARNPKLHENPDIFNPDRDTKTRSWLPFGRSRHLCPGESLVRADMSAVVPALVQRYEISSTPNQPDLSFNGYLTLQIAEKVKLTFYKRT